jgi:competence protein CoiA
MHAMVSRKGLRFFAHDVRPEACSSQGEGPEHRDLKRRVADAIRAAGGQALIEALPLPSDRGGWRADVLAVGLDGRRVAFEVQLAVMSVDEGASRTKRYAADRIATVWITTKHAHWMSCLPPMRLLSPDPPKRVAW